MLINAHINSVKVYTQMFTRETLNICAPVCIDSCVDTYGQDSENKSGILEVIFKTEMDLADVFRRLRVVNIHIDQ